MGGAPQRNVIFMLSSTMFVTYSWSFGIIVAFLGLFWIIVEEEHVLSNLKVTKSKFNGERKMISIDTVATTIGLVLGGFLLLAIILFWVFSSDADSPYIKPLVVIEEEMVVKLQEYKPIQPVQTVETSSWFYYYVFAAGVATAVIYKQISRFKTKSKSPLKRKAIPSARELDTTTKQLLPSSNLPRNPRKKSKVHTPQPSSKMQKYEAKKRESSSNSKDKAALSDDAIKKAAASIAIWSAVARAPVSTVSLSEERAQNASRWVEKEVDKLILVIKAIGLKGPDGKHQVTFGTLFIAYQDISDTLVGILMRAKKRKLIEYPGEMLLQTKDDHVIISLL